ncbi:MAG: hypothetical protein AAF725_26470, partial [Acidobacteriota bacterium]
MPSARGSSGAALGAVLTATLSLALSSCGDGSVPVVSDDVPLFWSVYDKVLETEGEEARLKILREEYIAQGSPGLEKMIRARRYTAEEFLYAIESYHEFWESVREDSGDVVQVVDSLQEGIEQLRKVYPGLSPATIYFTVGALRSNGTFMDGDLLIGSELAFATDRTVSHELTEDLPHLPAFFSTNPKEQVVPLVLHEYIHTQQQRDGGYNLLAQALYEGVAEYAATAALGKESAVQAVRFGLENDERIKEKFADEMFSPWFSNWLWNSPDNEFGVRDLAYYVGYAIADRYIQASEDPRAALEELIELDSRDPDAIRRVVERSSYFDEPLEVYQSRFEKERPVLQTVDFAWTDPPSAAGELTLRFSRAMNTCCASADFGPRGKDHYPELQSVRWSETADAVTYSVRVEPGKEYEMLIQEGYRTPRGHPLREELIRFKAE